MQECGRLGTEVGVPMTASGKHLQRCRTFCCVSETWRELGVQDNQEWGGPAHQGWISQNLHSQIQSLACLVAHHHHHHPHLSHNSIYFIENQPGSSRLSFQVQGQSTTLPDWMGLVGDDLMGKGTGDWVSRERARCMQLQDTGGAGLRRKGVAFLALHPQPLQ